MNATTHGQHGRRKSCMALVGALVGTMLLLSGCGMSDKDRAVEKRGTIPADALRARMSHQADR